MSEARDIEETQGFRLLLPVSLEGGKWFAVSIVDAVRWGQGFQGFFKSAEPFRVAVVRVPNLLLADAEYRVRLDAIGPAYCVRGD